MRQIPSYVIRIYRRNAEAFSGLVEHVQSSRTASFRSFSELYDVLSGRKRFPRRSADRPDTTPPAPDKPGQ